MAKRICPRCGSHNTAIILWEMPNMTEVLRQKIDNKEIVLGGCCISGNEPTHYCNKCKKAFGGSYFSIPTMIKEMEFFIGGHFGPAYEVCLLYTESGQPELRCTSVLRKGTTDQLILNEDDDNVEVMSRWNEFNNDLLHCYLIDWKRNYADKLVVDGTGWELRVVFQDGTKIMRSGVNKFPPHWHKFLALFKK